MHGYPIFVNNKFIQDFYPMIKEGFMDNKCLDENVDIFFSNLENFTQNEGILGKPITHGNTTLIPVISITVGYGGNSNSKEKNLSGGFFGLGGKICTDAIIIMEKESISVISIDGEKGKIVDKIPKIMSTLDPIKQQNGNPESQGQ